MKTFRYLLLLASLVAACLAEVGVPCTVSSQCASDECCQIINIIIMSKKRVLPLQPFLGHNTHGTCQKLKQQGESCNSFDTINGYCGCASGLTCQTVHISTTATPVLLGTEMEARKMLPGYSSYCLP